MPELPEVETIVRGLRPALAGRGIFRVHITRPDIVRPAGTDLPSRLRGRQIRDVARRGKRILLTLDDGGRLAIHLGMTGRLTAESPEIPVRRHTHLILELSGAGPRQLRFCDPRRFGRVTWLGMSRGDAGLGPEPLLITGPQLAGRLAATRRAIKAALLDQKLVAGLGNIYVDESLFAAAIDPRTPANQLDAAQVCRLLSAIRAVLRKAIRYGGSTIRDYVAVNGESGRFQHLHQVYGQTGRPCPRCGTPIERITLAGRSTHFCPKCQRNRVKPASPRSRVT